MANPKANTPAEEAFIEDIFIEENGKIVGRLKVDSKKDAAHG